MTPPVSNPVSLDPRPLVSRSVFPNYVQPSTTADEPPAATLSPLPPRAAECPDLAFSRSFVYQFLAHAFDYPTPETWNWLCDPTVQDGLNASLQALAPENAGPLLTSGGEFLTKLQPEQFAEFHNDYISAVGHASRGSCPINEIEYGELRADPLFQPHRLADLAAFYQAFGMELAADAGERHDHLAVELEFMAILSAQQANLLNTTPDGEGIQVCQNAQAAFLCDHLGRWLPAFVRRLQRVVSAGSLGALARVALTFVEAECRRMGVTPGNQDLMLRPADAGAALCEGCGLTGSPPATEAHASTDRPGSWAQIP